MDKNKQSKKDSFKMFSTLTSGSSHFSVISSNLCHSVSLSMSMACSILSGFYFAHG